jgi:hypothetical protein
VTLSGLKHLEKPTKALAIAVKETLITIIGNARISFPIKRGAKMTRKTFCQPVVAVIARWVRRTLKSLRHAAILVTVTNSTEKKEKTNKPTNQQTNKPTNQKTTKDFFWSLKIP